MKSRSSQTAWRKWRASWRDTFVLLREFQKPLLLFVLLIIGCGFLFYYLSRNAGEPIDDPGAAIYLVLTLTFLQPSGEYPHAWYLQAFYFLMPVLGVGVLAQGLADFGFLFFNRRARSKEWDMAVASTLKNHVVLVGLGHLGYRVVKSLYDMHQDVVVIEAKPRSYLVSRIKEMMIPLVEGDGTQDTTMEACGIHKARSIILCTQNDSLNLHMALLARKYNPSIEVIIRIFDDGFAEALHKQFGFVALSATGMAAPVFAASAAGIDITPPLNIDGQANCMARLEILPRSLLHNCTVQDIEIKYDLSVVMLKRKNDTDLHPHGQRCVEVGDTLMVFGPPEKISVVVHDSTER